MAERLPEVWRNDETAELVNYMICSPDFGVDIGNYHAKAKKVALHGAALHRHTLDAAARTAGGETMKKCTGENCPMQVGYDVEKCAAIDECPYRTWPVTIADRIRTMSDTELAGVLYNFRIDFITQGLSGVSTVPADFREIKKWLETTWEGKP